MHFLDIYKGKKVLLTGHTGFKGAWMTYWLHALGADVYGYALKPEEKSLYVDLNADRLCHSEIADIRDLELLKQTIIDFQPNFVFHFAAQSIVRASYDDPIYNYEVNTIGTGHVLEALRTLESACSTIIITTDKVYENREVDYPYKESDPLGGYDPYSASKACADILTSSYIRSYFNPETINLHKKSICIVRAGNVIGGGDWTQDALIPDLIRSLQQDIPVLLRSPHAVRPWQHVLEALSGYLMLGARLSSDPQKYIGAWNFGPVVSDQISVQSLIEMAIEIWGSGKYEIVGHTDSKHEAQLLQLNISKAQKLLNWKPVFNAQEAITKTVSWYKNFILHDFDARKLVSNDISEYSQKLLGQLTVHA